MYHVLSSHEAELERQMLIRVLLQPDTREKDIGYQSFGSKEYIYEVIPVFSPPFPLKQKS